MSTDRPLYISSDAATQLKQQKKAAEEEKLKQHIAKEEEKLQARRAKQEQQLAHRAAIKERRRQAHLSDDEVARCCEDLEQFYAKRQEAKKGIERLEEIADAKQKKVIEAEKELVKLTARVERLKIEASQATGAIGEAQAATDSSIERLKKQRLEEAWDRSQRAWDQVQRAVKKKERCRATKKRAKGLLGL